MPLPVQLLLRSDHPVKSGGDLVLAREYEQALLANGYDARLDPITPASFAGGAGIGVLFNVDRFFEFAASAAALRRSGRPYVVAPIHHPPADVERFEREVRSGPLGLIAKAGRTAFGRERIKHIMRERTGAALGEALLQDPRATIARAIDDAALVVVQAPAEAQEVDRTFGSSIAGRSVWVPNGVTIDETVSIDGERVIDVLVAGRIEERKNQLAAARALGGSEVRVTFVGGENPRNAAYAAEFHRTVESHTNLRHLPHVSLPELRQLYTRSRLLLSTSFFEVVSLAELEAVAYGCRLISTTGGYMPDYLGDAATYLDPTIDPHALLRAVRAELSKGVNSDGMRLVREEYSWAASHGKLAAALHEAGFGPSDPLRHT